MTPRSHSHVIAWLRNCLSHQEVFKENSNSLSKSKPIIIKYFNLFIRGPDGFHKRKNRRKNSRYTLSLNIFLFFVTLDSPALYLYFFNKKTVWQHGGSITLSRCRCREAKNCCVPSRGTVFVYYLKIKTCFMTAWRLSMYSEKTTTCCLVTWHSDQVRESRDLMEVRWSADVIIMKRATLSRSGSCLSGSGGGDKDRRCKIRSKNNKNSVNSHSGSWQKC